jgi:hypothetical protein
MFGLYLSSLKGARDCWDCKLPPGKNGSCRVQEKGREGELSLTMVNLVGCGGAPKMSLPCGML